MSTAAPSNAAPATAKPPKVKAAPATPAAPTANNHAGPPGPAHRKLHVRSGPLKSSVPLRVLMESVRSTVAIEMVTGEVYRGYLLEAQENMNCRLNNITVTYRDGRTRHLDHVFIRGSKIRFLVLPDHLMDKFKAHLKLIEDNAKAGKRMRRAIAAKMRQKRKRAAQERASGAKETSKPQKRPRTT
eukprot:EG_transcript_19730